MPDKNQLEWQRKVIRDEHKEYIDEQVKLILTELSYTKRIGQK